jgi:glycosyltransferase involved in cell wall biosynthesis
VHVIPFGANVDAPDERTVRAQIEARTFDQLRLLFVGRDWYRKGGDIVLATCEELRRRGVAVRLDLVGLLRVPELLPPYAQSHGLLDRKEPGQRRRLEQLFAQAHFLFVPSRAENYGMVFCEAAAFGLPSIATRIGGIPSIVRDGQSGFMLPAQATPQDYASTLESLLSDPSYYRMMSRTSLNDYKTRLNWTAFAGSVLAVLHGLSERASVVDLVHAAEFTCFRSKIIQS